MAVVCPASPQLLSTLLTQRLSSSWQLFAKQKFQKLTLSACHACSNPMQFFDSGPVDPAIRSLVDGTDPVSQDWQPLGFQALQLTLKLKAGAASATQAMDAIPECL
jgi:hypothetical protein